jgi:hypothetical protein
MVMKHILAYGNLKWLWKFDKRVKGQQNTLIICLQGNSTHKHLNHFSSLLLLSLIKINLKPSFYLYYLVIWKKMKSNFQFKFQYKLSKHGVESSSNISSLAHD